MKRSIIAVISGAVILIIAAKSIYMKSESGHKKGEPDVVGTFSINRDENITVVANRENIEDREAFARELLQMYKDYTLILVHIVTLCADTVHSPFVFNT